MADLEHTPLRTPLGALLRYFAASVPEDPCFFMDKGPGAVGHVCTACGCFYVPTLRAVCSNKVMEVLKEKVL